MAYVARVRYNNCREPMSVLTKTFSEFSEDDCPRMAAALSYYTVFALPPMLILILMVAGLFVSQDQIMQLLQGQMSQQAAQQVQTMVQSAGENVSGGFSLALLLSILGLLFSASGAFSQFQKALNAAWEVEPDPEQKGAGKVVHFLTKRLLSLGMIVVVAFLLVVALVVSGLISASMQTIASYLGSFGLAGPAANVLVWAADVLFSVALLWLLFALLFKVLPDAKVQWKDVRVGAFVTAVLFVIGKIAIAWYIGRSNPGSAFGAAGALAVILLFVYYSSMIVLLGAEFTQVWARKHGHRVRPAKHAVKVVERKEHVRDGAEASRGEAASTRRHRP